jgi:peptidoglycan/LPS O-acetylase OafA/YrhL
MPKSGELTQSINFKVGSLVPELDGIRGLAILPVLVYHLIDIVPNPAGFNETLFFRICRSGWFGVDLFFVLSGYLITNILLQTKDRPNYIRSFYGRRFLRIFPLYYSALGVFFIMTPIVSQKIAEYYTAMTANQIWFWLYGANILFAIKGSFSLIPGGYFWSLAVEEQFYLIWPWVVRHITRKRLLNATIGLFFTSLAIRLFFLYVLNAAPTTVYCLPFTHMDSLALGSFIALRFSEKEGVEIVAKRFYILGLAALALILMTAYSLGSLSFWHPDVATFTYSLLAIFFASLLVFVVSGRWSWCNHRIFSNPVLRSFGKYSYSLYIIHPAIGHVLGMMLPPILISSVIPSYAISSLIFIAVGTGVCWIISYLSWHLFEKHFLNLKKYFEYGRESGNVLQNQNL